MAKKKVDQTEVADVGDENDFSQTLIASLNKEFGLRVAYNLSSGDAPTNVKRWISTGSKQLDYIISNRRNGGVPEGRVIEIYGPPSIGKSHLAYQMARNTQAMGGLVVYIDTENATSAELLGAMGIDVTKRFVYCDEHCTENVFKIIESTILKAKQIVSKDIPILVVWDSVAATSPKQELEGDYDKDTIGLNARVISKGMRKIVGVIGQNNVTMVCLNQIRTKVGFVMGDPTMVPGGKSIPFHASVMLKLLGGQLIKVGNDVMGISVSATVVKNKIARPHKKVFFNIMFGKGLEEHQQILEVLRKRCEKTDEPLKKDGKMFMIEKSGQSHNRFAVIDESTGEVLVDKKYTKNSFAEAFTDPEVKPYIEDMLEVYMTSGTSVDVESEGDVGTEDESE